MRRAGVSVLSRAADSKKGNANPTFSWIDSSFLPVGDIGLAVFLLLIALVGIYVVVYAIALGFTHIPGLGEVSRARKYGNDVDVYELNDSERVALARELYRVTLYFSIILLVFAVEDGARYLLHTGQ